jgi:hypothetical protein
LTQVLVGGAEAGEHVHEGPARRLLGGDDAVCVGECVGQRKLPTNT